MPRNALVNVCVAVAVACAAVLLVASVVNAQSPHPKSSQTVTPAIPRAADLSAPHVIATVQFPLGLIKWRDVRFCADLCLARPVTPVSCERA